LASPEPLHHTPLLRRDPFRQIFLIKGMPLFKREIVKPTAFPPFGGFAFFFLNSSPAFSERSPCSEETLSLFCFDTPRRMGFYFACSQYRLLIKPSEIHPLSPTPLFLHTSNCKFPPIPCGTLRLSGSPSLVAFYFPTGGH